MKIPNQIISETVELALILLRSRKRQNFHFIEIKIYNPSYLPFIDLPSCKDNIVYICHNFTSDISTM